VGQRYIAYCKVTIVQLSNVHVTLNLNVMYMFLQHSCYSLHNTQHQFERSPCSIADAACNFQSCWATCQKQHNIYFRRAFCDGPTCKCGKRFSS